MISLRMYVKEIALIVLHAVLHASIFHFTGLWWVASFSLVPLFACLLCLRNRWEAFKFGYAAGVMSSALTYFWVAHVTKVGVVVLVAYMGLFTGLFAALVFGPISIVAASGSLQFRHGWLKIFAISSIWVLVEYVRSYIPVLGFPWALFGYSQWKNLVFIQSAEYLGVWGVSFVLVFFNVALFALCTTAWRLFKFELSFVDALKQVLIVLTALAAIVGANISFGTQSLSNAAITRVPESGPKITVIQGNIPQHEKWNDKIKDTIFQKYEGLSRQAAFEKPDLVVWPETAFPGYYEIEPGMAKQLQDLIRAVGSRFLVGAPTLGIDEQGEVRLNSAIYFSQRGQELGRYHKLRLVPFGEYVPFFSFLRHLFVIGRFSPGKAMVVFELPTGSKQEPLTRFSVLTCFEDIFPNLVRASVNRGSRILINITNDAWFKKTTAPYQHAQASVFRAIENRVPVVRAANTGYSCFIDSTGFIYGEVQDGGENIFVTGIRTEHVQSGGQMTFYRFWGDVFVALCFLISLGTAPLYFGRVNRPPQPDVPASALDADLE